MTGLSQSSPRRRQILLAGNPNAGKSTLFNALTGMNIRTGNYPGVTVERSVASLTLPGGEEVDLVDLPGAYSLCARSPEEEVCIDQCFPLDGPGPDLVIVVVDATVLVRNLYLATQILEGRLRVILALNMMDELRQSTLELDVAGLAAA